MDGRLRHSAGFLAGGGDTPSPTPDPPSVNANVYWRDVDYDGGKRVLVDYEGKLIVYEDDGLYGQYDVNVLNGKILQLETMEWSALEPLINVAGGFYKVSDFMTSDNEDTFKVHGQSYRIDWSNGNVISPAVTGEWQPS